MERRRLGDTGIEVSRLCLGTLTMGPLQAGIGVREGAGLIEAGWGLGVNFLDTAELYGTYPHIREALKVIPRDRLIISSRSYAYTYDGMRRSVEKALSELRTDYIDIFGMHEQVSRLTLQGHSAALEYLCHARQAGTIRAVSVSTHTVEVVQAVQQMPEIDVVHPLFNMAGIGIIDGGTREMEEAIQGAYLAGKGIYTMKALAGGHLFRQAATALRWVHSKESVHSIAVGVKTVAELDMDVLILSGEDVSSEAAATAAGEKRLHIEEWCAKCGSCVAACGHGALRMGEQGVIVDESRCVLCGYCGAHCPEFCIKVI
ncbi:MAG: aldo/keto reductase [Firmicutes bacterium]|nr:aldo/keto reductase [Bacillota bacterium]